MHATGAHDLTACQRPPQCAGWALLADSQHWRGGDQATRRCLGVAHSCRWPLRRIVTIRRERFTVPLM